MIPDEEHCRIKSGNDCTKCQSGYFLWNAKCYAHFHYQSEYCETQKDFTGLTRGHENKLECLKCKTGYIWKSLAGNNLCLDEKQLASADRVANCIRYYLSAGRYVCEQCASGSFLSTLSPPTCISLCDTPELVRLTFDSNLVKTEIINKQTNICQDGQVNKVYTTDSSLSDPRMLAKCPANNFGTYSDAFTTFDINNKSFSNGMNFTIYAACKAVNGSLDPQNSFPDFKVSTNKCKHYYEKPANSGKFYCVSCQHGFTGPIKSDGGQTYVDCNKEIQGCQSKQFGGLQIRPQAMTTHGINSQVFFSCHQCTTTTIPFLFAPVTNRVVSWANFQPFDMTKDIPQSNTTGGDNQIKCVLPIKENFYKTTATTVFFPSNCGLGLFDTSKTRDLALANPASWYCVECAPGFKKVLDGNNVITQCKEIPNCDKNASETWFNTCSKCLNTHVWTWSLANGIHYDECIQKTIPNCLVQFDVAGTPTCKYCQKGFDLIDGKCEQYKVSKCSSYLEQPLKIDRPTPNPLGNDNFWLIAYLYQQKGCETCVSDQTYTYVSVKNFLGTHEACVGSYIKSEQKSVSSLGVIPYCLFQDGGKIACLTCNQGYILREGGQECLINKTFTNCNLINVTNDCISCESGYFLIKKQCVRGTIDNCIQYHSDKEVQECIMCAEGYRPGVNNKSCILGNLNYCQFYANQTDTSCSTCVAQGVTFKYSVNGQNQS